MSANYATVRRYLGKHFDLSKTSTGCRSGQRWSPGVQVRTTYNGVVVDYLEGSAAFYSDGSLREAKLKEIRAYLSVRFLVTDHASEDGRLVITDLPQ